MKIVYLGAYLILELHIIYMTIPLAWVKYIQQRRPIWQHMGRVCRGHWCSKAYLVNLLHLFQGNMYLVADNPKYRLLQTCNIICIYIFSDDGREVYPKVSPTNITEVKFKNCVEEAAKTHNHKFYRNNETKYEILHHCYKKEVVQIFRYTYAGSKSLFYIFIYYTVLCNSLYNKMFIILVSLLLNREVVENWKSLAGHNFIQISLFYLWAQQQSAK